MPMTSSFIKIFKFRKSKENDQVDNALKRNDGMRLSLRGSPVPTCRSSKDAIYIGGTSWSRPSAPYSIVTAPKKTKSSRSCPGGVSAPAFRPVSREEQRYMCPSHFQNSGGRSTDVKETDASVKTSEYGSCEPSPTNVSQGLICSHQDSDYDNDFAVQELQRYEAEIRKLKRRIRDDRHHYKEQVVGAQNEADLLRRENKKISRTLVLMQRTIDGERHKNQNLRRRLREAETVIAEMRDELSTMKKKEAEQERYGCYEGASASGALGAGEALCTLTQSSADLFSIDFNPQFSDASDEVRNFRVTQYETPSVVETPRSSSPLGQHLDIGKPLDCAPEEVVCNEGSVNDPLSPARRSHSDSDLPGLLAALHTDDLFRNTNEMSRHAIASPVVKPMPFSLGHGHEETKTEKGITWSSDEESVTQELICKQLRHRGDVVRFIPPRRTIRDVNFRHFGHKERSALAEFDYLHDLSTDASAIASSPDYPERNSANVACELQPVDA